MDNPDWAAIKAADATYSAMIAARVSAVATCFAVVFAAMAAWWAKKAVAEASRQANAASQCLGLATEEIELLKKQIELSQPRPVVILRMQYTLGSVDAPEMLVENVGDDTAFDVQVGEIGWRGDGIDELIARFIPEYFLPSGKNFGVVPDAEKFVLRGITKLANGPFQLRQVLNLMADTKLRNVSNLDLYKEHVIGNVSVTYTNLHAMEFEQNFRIRVGGKSLVDCRPQESLLK